MIRRTVKTTNHIFAEKFETITGLRTKIIFYRQYRNVYRYDLNSYSERIRREKCSICIRREK